MSDIETATTRDEIAADAPPIAPPPAGPPPPKKKSSPVPAKRALVSDDESADIRETRDMLDWLRDGVGDAQDFRLVLSRLEPEFYGGKRIKGHIDTYTAKIDETMVKAMFGGGRYKIQLMMPTSHGDYRHSRAKSFDIAGDPIVNGGGSAAAPLPAPREDTTVATRAMDLMAQQLEKADDRAARGSGVDADAIARSVQVSTAPLNATIEMLTRQLESAQKSAQDARTAPPDPVRDRVMDKLLNDDSSRMEAIRIAHRSEVDALRQSAIDLEARLRDKHERELVEMRSDHKTERDRSERQHEREIAEMKRSYDSQIQILRDAHTREVTSLTTVNTITGKVSEGDSKRLERENADLRAEVKMLREKKDKSIFEQAKEIEEIKDLFGGEGEEKKGYERVIEAVGNVPAIQKILGKLAGTDGNGQAHQQLPPPHVPFVGQDGQTYVHDGQGNFSIVQQRRRLKQRAQRPPAPPPPPPAPPADATPEVIQQHQQATEQHAAAVKEAQIAQAVATIDPAQVALAVGYLEQAFQKYKSGADANFDPKTVASSIRSQGLAPAAVIQFLKDQGVDVLLEKVARLEPSSPFKTQAGINWIRKVAKELA